MNTGFFTQLAMIVLAALIGFVYISPTLSSISEAREEVELYKTEREKINSVNAELEGVVNDLESIAALDRNKLLTYIPDSVDGVEVSRLLQIIAQNNGLLIEEITYGGVDASFDEPEDEFGIIRTPIPHQFQLMVAGGYQQIKGMLNDLEWNEFPLEVHQLEIAPIEGNFLQANALIVTYSHRYPEESFFNNL